MKGPAPIPIPVFFTASWYDSQKSQGKTDVVIADELFISVPLLANWKKKVGCQPYRYNRRPRVDPDKIISLFNQGLTKRAVAKALGIKPNVVSYHVKKAQ